MCGSYTPITSDNAIRTDYSVLYNEITIYIILLEIEPTRWNIYPLRDDVTTNIDSHKFVRYDGF